MPKRKRRKQLENPRPELPPNVRLTVGTNRVEIVYRSRLWHRGISFGFFAALWNGFLVLAALEMLSQGTSWTMLCFMIPFYLVGTSLLCMFLRCFMHREVIVLDERGFDWTLSVIIPILHRNIPWGQKLRIRKGSFHDQNRIIGSWGAEIQNCRTKPFSVFLDMKLNAEGNTVRGFLRRQIETYQAENNLPDQIDSVDEAEIHQRGTFELRYHPDFFEIYRRPFHNLGERIVFKFIFVLFATFVGIITVAMVRGLFYETDPQRLVTFVFGSLVVFAGWLVVLALGIGLLGRHSRWETLRIDAAGGRYTERVWLTFLLVNVTWRKREISIGRLGLSYIYRTEKGDGIELTASDKPLRCFPGLLNMTNPDVLVKPLNEQLARFGVTERIQPPMECDSQGMLKTGRWMVFDDGRTMTFYRRGWISANLLFSQLFVFLFWGCGTVVLTIGSVVLIATFKLYLLIPFAVVFLLPFIAHLAILILGTTTMFLQYFCRYQITIDSECVRYRRSWFGIGLTRRWPLDQIDKVVLEERKTLQKHARLHEFIKLDLIRNPEGYEPNDKGIYPIDPFEIRLNGKGDPNQSIGHIRDLYKNEASRIASSVRQRKNEPLGQ